MVRALHNTLNEFHRIVALLVIIKDEGACLMILIQGSLSFAKLVIMSSAPAKSVGDARYTSQDPFIHYPIQSRLQSVLGVRSFYIKCNDIQSSHKRPPQELDKVAVTRAGLLQECTLSQDQEGTRMNSHSFKSLTNIIQPLYTFSSLGSTHLRGKSPGLVAGVP